LHWLLQSHISEEVVEIICAYFFVGGGRVSDMDTEQTSQHLVPGSKERGFSAVVKFLKEWRWENGLVVPLYGPQPANLSDVSTPLVNNVIHKGVWRVSTEHDKEGHVWTCNGPDLVVAHRVRSLADATWNCLQTLELNPPRVLIPAEPAKPLP
jgi:U3 small nucleolar RNA-associated protein 22